MVGNRFSHNGYSYTRAPTLDWGNAPGGVAPTVTFDQVSNGKPWQAAEPLLAVASNLGLRDFGFALAAFAAPGASNLTFPPGGGQRYMMLEREAIILNYAASAAWKFRDVFGVGATLEWIDVPRLDYSLVIDGSPFAGAANPVVEPARHDGGHHRFGSVHVQRHPRRLVPAGAVPAVRRGGAGRAHQHRDQEHAGGDAARTSRPRARSS